MKFINQGIVLLILAMFHFENINSQSQDSALVKVSDSSKILKKSPGPIRNMFRGKPGKALSYSLILPGLGQMYNKRYWKLPLVYGALAVPVYSAYFNRKEFIRFRDAYIMRIDLGENSNDEFQGILSPSGIKLYRDIYDKNLQRSYLACFGVYLLIGIEAFVDRHLMTFDVGDDLSLDLRPQIQSGAAGLGICLNLK
jgi:hypothetical protein